MTDEPSSGQRLPDRQFADGLVWAQWAVGRWSAFPVDVIPRPLVMVGQRVLVEHGFATGEAKLAFLEGRIERSVAVPVAVRDQLTDGPVTSKPRGLHEPLVITAAEQAETEFVTDRGPACLSA